MSPDVPMEHKHFGVLLERVILGERISAKEVGELAEFVGSDRSTEAQRAGLVTALGIWYLRQKP